MESIIRKVRDIEARERRVLEQVLGRQLSEDQQLIVQIADSAGQCEQQEVAAGKHLPDWCNVYAGLTDEQVKEVEEIILQRMDLTRPSE